MIEDPESTLIITRQNHCDDHLFLYQALKAASNTTDSASVKDSTMPPMEQPATVPTAKPNTYVAGTMNRQRFSAVVPIKNKHGLQGALNDRYLNGGNHTVQCPIEGCGGLQPLKITIEKMPAILVIDPAVDEENTMSLCFISDIESNLMIQGTPYVLVQVILHNGSHFRGITVLNNQNVLYDGILHNKLKPISKTETFASAEMMEIIGCHACGTEKF